MNIAALSRPLKLSKLFSTKLVILASAVLFFGLLFLVGYEVYKSQPAHIMVDTKGLNTAQYNALSQTLSQQKVDNFFTASLPELQQQVMSQDWVSQVNIERVWGKGIVVTALPRQAVARFGSDLLIDNQGAVFKAVSDVNVDDSLIMLQGDKSQSHLIMQQMHQVNRWFSPLGITVEDMILTPRMTWVIRFNDGLRIIVDNELTSQKLMNASQLMQTQLSEQKDDIAALDLRYKNGLSIAWKNQ